jgi:sigma-54 dependent transcriptional regulator, acetoin dehydrogenase operon transcriptional activator AcoR
VSDRPRCRKLRPLAYGAPSYARVVSRIVEMEAARRSFLAAGPCTATRDLVRPEVLASWERSHHHDSDPDRITARFLGHHRDEPGVTDVADVAEAVFDEFFATGHDDLPCSLVLSDPSGVVRVRRDGDRALGRLLDGLLLVPGYGYGERSVGTTAASVARHEHADVTISGPEHYHSQLACLSEAAALVTGPRADDKGGEAAMCGVVTVLCHQSAETSLQLPLARMLARRITERMADERHRRPRAILECFDACDRAQARTGDRVGGWVLATDGNLVLTNAGARHLDAADLGVLSDLVLANLVLRDFVGKHVDLPSGACCEVDVRAVRHSGEVVGCVLTGGPVGNRPSPELPEAVRRQGAHVAPMTRRDYARDLRRCGDTRKAHAEARIRANRELLTPFLRARNQVVASIRQGGGHLLIGEPGVGKHTMVLQQFHQSFPDGRVVVVDCAAVTAEPGATPHEPTERLLHDMDDRPSLVLLRTMNALTPIGARRLDESLRLLVALPTPPVLIGCVDTPAVDATRPYGLFLRHFNEVTRIPALRYRLDEIGDIARSILRRVAASRSLRLSLQVVRVLESYAWPGNISELEDVLRYVVARKPLGEIQPPDLPRLCFQGRARKMSMLEAAQCDAIIQALYESGGNRYKAAAMLGIARSSLYRKIDAFGISYIA